MELTQVKSCGILCLRRFYMTLKGFLGAVFLGISIALIGLAVHDVVKALIPTDIYDGQKIVADLELVEHAGLYFDPTWKFWTDGDNKLTFSELEQLVVRFGDMTQKFPEPMQAVYDPAALYGWAAELLPMYEYEHLSQDTLVPEEILPEFMADGDYHNRVLGHTDCKTTVYLNLRALNRFSDWSNHESVLWTLTHELAHMQQGDLCSLPTKEVEMTAQVMAAEVLSALANQGSEPAF